MSTPIATFRKNGKEEVRVSLDDFKGRRLVNIRVWFEADDGEMRPGRQRIALRLELLPELQDALEAAAAAAADEGKAPAHSARGRA